MNVRSILSRLAIVATILATVLIVTGSLLGQPFFLGYVETGSMKPTMSPGDGFVSVPSSVAGSVREGDVVVFKPEEINGAEITTHRIVGETDRGYITQGDANPFTDQSDREPPVKDAQIVAKALQINGNVVVIPHLGTAVEGIQSVLRTVQGTLASLLGTGSVLGTQGLAYLFFAGALLFYAFDWYREGATRERAKRITKRDTGVSMRLVLVGFATLLVVGATAAMVAPSGTQQYGVVSAEFESERPNVVPMGESKTHSYEVFNGGLVPQQVYVEPASEGIAVSQQRLYVGGGQTVGTAVTLFAPPETGYYRRYLVEHRYLAVLPGGVVDSLYRVHPWAPIVAIDALLAGGFLALTLPFAPGGRIRKRTRNTGGLLGTVTRRFKRLVG
ncbi:signal peptidase I [Halomarina oriensis]|uniref:Signal peptidase I n=1 Tax=Halomarina oriensis TaxID=671145 RepID=A0A6B0GFE3_9EURY|nr:signal peptidase I [Halomarina oriensis]MWG33542.1 signal peptidase I [Halomarina oriensis]